MKKIDSKTVICALGHQKIAYVQSLVSYAKNTMIILEVFFAICLRRGIITEIQINASAFNNENNFGRNYHCDLSIEVTENWNFKSYIQTEARLNGTFNLMTQYGF